MTSETKDILTEILHLLKEVSVQASENSRRAYLGQFTSGFSYDEKIDEIINKINAIPATHR